MNGCWCAAAYIGAERICLRNAIAENRSLLSEQFDRDVGENAATSDFIEKKLFPHLNTLYSKQLTLAYMVLSVLKCKSGMLPVDNQRNYGNKRLLGTGPQMSVLFRNLYLKTLKETLIEINNEFKSAASQVKNSHNIIMNTFAKKAEKKITEQFVKAINQGKWPLSGSGNDHEGVTTTVERKSINDTISNLNKVTTSIDPQKKKKNPDMNQYDTSQTCYFSPNGTVDGPNVGIHKEKNASMIVTTEIDSTIVYELINSLDTKKLSSDLDELVYSKKIKGGEISKVDLDINISNTNTNINVISEIKEGKKKIIEKSSSTPIIIQPIEMKKKIEDTKPKINDYEYKNKYPHFISIKKMNISNYDEYYKIFINADVVGLTRTPKLFREYLITYRKLGIINPLIEITTDFLKREFRIYTDEGRCCMPYLIVEEDTKNMIGVYPSKKLKIDETNIKSNPITWDDLCKKVNGKGPYIEYIDIHEAENNCIVAMNIEQIKKEPHVKFTHCLIHPTFYVSYNEMYIPFLNFNQAPRIVYEYQQIKQAIGIPLSNYKKHRMDQTLNVLDTTEKQIVNTDHVIKMGLGSLPGGLNLIVAIMCFTGYNEEDAIIVNGSSTKLGLFALNKYMTYTSRTENNQIFQKPSEAETDRYKSNNSYEHLNSNGHPKIGDKLKNGDIIIGKVIENHKLGESKGKKYTDDSVIFTGDSGTYVDKIPELTQDNIGKDLKVRTYTHRTLRPGDKLSSRYGQKGTVSILFRRDQLPFTKNGMVPDIIINPHCIPSRMTIGQLMESLLGKYAALKGTFADGSGFTEFDHEKIGDYLDKNGFDRYGEEYMYDPISGKRTDKPVFIGVTYYQRLKQMINDKTNVRSSGKVEQITGQPVGGKSVGGGPKVGEMESSAFIAHGMSKLHDELWYNKSDGIDTFVCGVCGKFCIGNEQTGKFRCKGCGENTNIKKIRFSKASKMLLYEFYGIGIAPRLRF